MTPFLTTTQVATTLTVFGAVYALIFIAGTIYIYRLLKAGVFPTPAHSGAKTNPKRPFSVPGSSPGMQTTPGAALSVAIPAECRRWLISGLAPSD